VSDLAVQAERAAEAAASRASVDVAEVEGMGDLRRIARLFLDIWGPSTEGAPLPSELMRSLMHAGGAVTAATDAEGELAGAAVLVPAQAAGSTYSLIAAARRSVTDRGIGFALKQRQRAWAIGRERTTMTWTFDPLVARNARFNLTKLGASVTAYVENFYGRMDDAVNASDESDRLVVRWDLASARAIACSEGRGDPPPEPDLDVAEVRAVGPDGGPALVTREDTDWCRVPSDIVDLRQRDADQANAWRSCVREVMEPLLASGRHAIGVTRSGWYVLVKAAEPS
jgi:predicted GNAT superfamily acetyltransferase